MDGFGAINLESKLLVSQFVHPDRAGQGFGQQMLEFLIELARCTQLTELKLDSSINALGFYAKNGFVEVGRGRYETQNGTLLESVKMRLTL